MKASDYIVSYFESLGVSVIFGYQGGVITHLIDSISKNPNIRFIQTYHEQSAAIAAEGYARESGKIGVAISTSGPGATNMITGIANAFFDSIPVVYITGQVNTYEYKYCKKIRQQGFQETDIISIVKPITKYAVLIDNPKNLQHELSKAVSIATMGRKGPVLIDLPMDVQRSEIELDNSMIFHDTFVAPDCTSENITEVLTLLEQARKPLVLCGGGITGYQAIDKVELFLRSTGLPVVVSLMGKGTVDESLPNFIGMIGSYGNRSANIIFSQADVVLVLGSRLDLRQTGDQKSEILKKILFIHVDIDSDELENESALRTLNIYSDLGLFLDRITPRCAIQVSDEWNAYIKRTCNSYNQSREIERFVANKAPYDFIDYIYKKAEPDCIFTADIGQNQMWAAQRIQMKKTQRFYTSGGLAPMGYALHAAIGAAFASPEKHLYCIIGDGGFHIAIQSLLLIAQYKLHISVCVFNNRALGMITQFQVLYFNSNLTGTTSEGGYLVPDIQSLANAYNLSYKYISDAPPSDEKDKIEYLQIIEFGLRGKTIVSPKLEYNQPLYNMTPFLSSAELKEFL